MPARYTPVSSLSQRKPSTLDDQDSIASKKYMLKDSIGRLSPLLWWRTRPPQDLSYCDVQTIREVLLGSDPIGDYDWLPALAGDSAAAIGVAIRVLKAHGMSNPLIDRAMSAVLCCLLEDDRASIALMTSALRRRAKIDPQCHDLWQLWCSI